jgi:hypothetical protein
VLPALGQRLRPGQDAGPVLGHGLEREHRRGPLHHQSQKGRQELRTRTFTLSGSARTIIWLGGREATRDRLVEGSLEEVLADLPAPQRTALEVALFLAEAEAPPDPQAVARAFLSSIRRLARDERVVIAVDDVQWLDAGSREALKFALRRLRAESVVNPQTNRVYVTHAGVDLITGDRRLDGLCQGDVQDRQ